MANEQPIYIPSTTPGKVWRVHTHKPQGRPAYASATEGELKTENGWQSFSCLIDFKAAVPYTRVAIQGPATAKKKAAAIKQLTEQLQAAGVTQIEAPV
jgi:hypothetical protein